MKTTITGFINYKPASYEGNQEFHFQACEMEEYGYITIMPHTIEVDIAEDFDPRAKQVAMLQAKKQELMADVQIKLNKIEEQIARLTALEYEVAA